MLYTFLPWPSLRSAQSACKQGARVERAHSSTSHTVGPLTNWQRSGGRTAQIQSCFVVVAASPPTLFSQIAFGVRLPVSLRVSEAPVRPKDLTRRAARHRFAANLPEGCAESKGARSARFQAGRLGPRGPATRWGCERVCGQLLPHGRGGRGGSPPGLRCCGRP